MVTINQCLVIILNLQLTDSPVYVVLAWLSEEMAVDPAWLGAMCNKHRDWWVKNVKKHTREILHSVKTSHLQCRPTMRRGSSWWYWLPTLGRTMLWSCLFIGRMWIIWIKGGRFLMRRLSECRRWIVSYHSRWWLGYAWIWLWVLSPMRPGDWRRRNDIRGVIRGTVLLLLLIRCSEGMIGGIGCFAQIAQGPGSCCRGSRGSQHVPSRNWTHRRWILRMSVISGLRRCFYLLNDCTCSSFMDLSFIILILVIVVCVNIVWHVFWGDQLR